MRLALFAFSAVVAMTACHTEPIDYVPPLPPADLSFANLSSDFGFGDLPDLVCLTASCSCLDGTNKTSPCNGSCLIACKGHGGPEPPGVCGPGSTACNGACTQLQTDNNNCGACGQLCVTFTSCVAGQCKVELPPNESLNCRSDADCPNDQECVLNATVGCPDTFCAPRCDGDAGTCATGVCGAAIAVSTSATLLACIPVTECP